VRALERLCSKDHERVLVQVFHHRQGNEGLSPYDLYQIDMELCAKSLKVEIKERTPSLRELLEQISSTQSVDRRDNFYENSVLEMSLASNCFDIHEILRQILKGLTFIHSLGQVHRDLKPENGTLPNHRMLMEVLFSLIDKRWKIADFGATKEGTSTSLRVTSLALATSSYRAPELMNDEGEDGRYISRTDIWAFGCVTYEICTKEKAFLTD
jgi:serine/threonine protein kinase